MITNYEMLDLQRFADGAAGAGVGSAGDGAATGVSEADAASQIGRRRATEGQQADVWNKGYNPAAQTTQQAATGRDAAGNEDAPEETFESLIKGKYRDEYKARVDKALNGRFKQTRQMETRLGKMQPIIEVMAECYGIDFTDPEAMDLDALYQRVTQDKKMYEEEAMREGVPVEILMQRKNLQRQQRALDTQQRRIAEENEARAEMSELMSQAVALKSTIPDFDIEREMLNPAFARMVLKAPRGSGVPLEAAYYAVHHAEIDAARRQQQYQTTQQAVRQTAQMVSNAVASGSRRPAENGSGAAAAAITTADPSKFGKAELKAVYAAVARGEAVRF